jgi:hypothetical protein
VKKAFFEEGTVEGTERYCEEGTERYCEEGTVEDVL